MLQYMFAGVLISILVEVLKSKKANKVNNIAKVFILSTIASLLSMFILDTEFFQALFFIVVYAGAFYAYVLRSITK